MYRNRVDELQNAMEADGIDYVFFTPSPNMFYFSGCDVDIYERHLFLIVEQDGEPMFFLPELYEAQVRDDTWITRVETWSDSESPRRRLGQVLGQDGEPGRILLEDTMQARFALDIIDMFPDAAIDPASEICADIRIRKSQEEIEKIRGASVLADEIHQEIRERGAELVGMTENEVAELIKQKMKENGVESPSFEPVVGSGPNGAKPHHRHSDRPIQEGDSVVLDFGCTVGHYASDQTRTVVPHGDPGERFREVHSIVREAQRQAIEKIQPGIAANEVDAAAREYITEKGYGEQFLHRTGHGVGLDIHEPPYINQANERRLDEGMVFSVEPGVYIDGRFGVRIEDLVVVTAGGCERLNTTKKEW